MPQTDQLQWLLDDFLSNTPDAEYACVFSKDGLPMQRSSNMEKEQAERLGAASSGMRSLGLEVSGEYNRGDVVLNHVELERGFLFICAAGPGACLVVLTEPEVDDDALPMVAYAMKRLVGQVRECLTAAPRAGA
jgi:predicted regulator of Ras-like GTPase activity (Roadblock/LC7/MglB family)